MVKLPVLITLYMKLIDNYANVLYNIGICDNLVLNSSSKNVQNLLKAIYLQI